MPVNLRPGTALSGLGVWKMDEVDLQSFVKTSPVGTSWLHRGGKYLAQDFRVVVFRVSSL